MKQERHAFAAVGLTADQTKHRWRAMTKWLVRIALTLLLLFGLAVLGGAAYESLGARQAARDYPPTGQLVDIGGRRLQLDCRGQGSPTVVFESGLDMLGALSWSAVHDDVATITRACAYSRAGILWSDPADGPRDARAVAADLYALLQQAEETGPLVLVGHSLGGPYVMAYTQAHGGEVAGVVLVDATHPDQVARLAEIGAPTEMSASAQNIQAFAARLHWTGLVRAFANAQGVMPHMPPGTDAIMKAYAATSLGPMLAESSALKTSLAQAGTARDLGQRPLYVLTAMAPFTAEARQQMGITPEQALRVKDIWRALHEEAAGWSSRGLHEAVPDADHYIQFDRPDRVVAAVRSVVNVVRGQP